MYEIPQLPLDDASGKDIAKLDLKMSSHQVTLHTDTSELQDRNMTPRKTRRGRDWIRLMKPMKFLISARDDTTVKTNPGRSENVITSSNLAYGSLQVSRQKND